jgi:hypothetical protein
LRERDCASSCDTGPTSRRRAILGDVGLGQLREGRSVGGVERYCCGLGHRRR